MQPTPIQPAAGANLLQGSAPNIQPSANGTSLQGTMVAPKPAPAPAPAPIPAKQTSSTQTQSSSPATAPAAAPTAPGAPQTAPQVNPSQMANYLSTIQDKLKAGNVLADARAKLVTALYDRPLTPEEVQSLPPNVQTAIAGGDKRQIEMQIRLLNDQIQGRTNSLDQSVKFLSDEYDKSLTMAETQKQNAIDNVLKFVQQYGSHASEALKSLYGQPYIDSLAKYGINVNDLANLPTLTENLNSARYGTTSSGLAVNIPSGTLAAQNNNPGNLRFANQAGASVGAGGFAKFDSPAAGYKALVDQIKLDASRGLTLAQFIQKYAPPSENDTNGYIKQVSADLNSPDNTPISQLDPDSLAAAIAKKESGTTVAANETNSSILAKSLLDGTMVPSLISAYGGARNSANVAAKKLDPNYNPAKAELQYKAATKFIQTLNSPQMVRFNGLATSVVNTIDEVKTLADQMQNGGVPIMNAAKLATYAQTNGNSPQGQLAAKYLAAVNTLKEEFANLANGGYAPTDAAWGLANSQINGNYGDAQLKASLAEVQRLINFRVNAINEQQPNIGGESTPPGTTNALQVSASPSDTDPLGLGLK